MSEIIAWYIYLSSISLRKDRANQNKRYSFRLHTDTFLTDFSSEPVSFYNI